MHNVDISVLTREVEEVHEHDPRWTLDNAFVHWFLQAFLVSDSEVAAKCVTGVSHDKGVDAVYIDDAVSKVFVLQGKFHQGAKAPFESRSDVISFAGLARSILADKKGFDVYLAGIDPLVGKKISEGRERIRKRHYQLHLYYVTTGRCSSPLKTDAEGEIGQAHGRAAITVLDRSDVLALLTDYLGGAAPPVPFLDLPIDTRGISGSDGSMQRYDSESGIESWVIAMSGRDAGGLYTQAGDRLFARNIRGFLGDTAINDGMKETLKSQPEHFWYFNNGITIVCDSARKTAEKGRGILRVTNPQVINGQQTCRTLHSLPTSAASVLVRVISIPRDEQRTMRQFERLVSDIVASTNWQNAILPSDLRSNDTCQVALQRDLAKVRYQYLRKRQTKKEAKRALGNLNWFWIKKDELAQVVAACDLDPYAVRSGKEGLFKTPYYERIFDSRPIREYLNMYWAGRVIKYQGKGFPDRAYAKWYTLHKLWQLTAPILRNKSAAEYFRLRCERSRWFDGLDQATDQIYRSLNEFFKSRRGRAEVAIDISNFFYRPHQDIAFEKYWKSSSNRYRRRKTRGSIEHFREELEAMDYRVRAFTKD